MDAIHTTAESILWNKEGTVLEAIATVRDAVAYASATRTPMCVLRIDFKKAFDKISHSYLFAILKKYGFSEQFQQRIYYTDKWTPI